MQWYEVEACLEGLDHKNRNGWEQTRTISYLIAQSNSTKKLKPTDILKFHWDSEVKEENTTIANTDIERLKQKANQTLNIL